MTAVSTPPGRTTLLEPGAAPRVDPPAQGAFQMARVGRHAGIYGAGVMLNKAVAFVMLPVYTRYLSPADYGVMELITMTLNLVAIVAGAKLALGIFRYYHKVETPEERNAIVSTAMIGLAISYGVLGLLTFASASLLSGLVFGSGAHAPLVRLAAVALALESLIVVPLAYVRVREMSVVFVAANAARLVLGLSLNIAFVVYAGLGVRGVLLSSVVANAAVGGILAAWVVRRVGLRISRLASRDLLRYGVPLIGTQLAAFIATFGDRYFLQSTADSASVGLYALAYQFGFLLAAVGYMPFEMVWEPARFAIAKRDDRDELLSRGFLYMNVFLVSLAVVIALFVGDVLRIMTTPEFHAAASLVPVILVAYVLQGWTNVQDVGILVRERTEYITLANWTAALVALGAYWLLIPDYGGFGAAWATVGAFAVRYAIVYAISQRLWPVRYRWSPALRLVLLATLTTVAGELLPPSAAWISLAQRTVLLLGYLAALWHSGVLSVEDRAFVRRAVAAPRVAWAAFRT